MKKLFITLLAIMSILISNAQTWIWYPGDYEIWLGNQMNNRRTERGAFFPPFWKTDSHYATVEFSKQLSLAQPEEISIFVEGTYNVKLDGKLQFGMPQTFTLPVGTHTLCIKVHNQATPPAIYIKGNTVNSDDSWRVTYEDKEWIDESGKASDKSATLYMDAAHWNFDDANERPSQFKLSREPLSVVSVKEINGGKLYDFGKETFGYVRLFGLQGNGSVHIFYGESPEEAMDRECCETLDKLLVQNKCITDLAINSTTPIFNEYVLGNSKAFRYVFVQTENVSADSIGMFYEYLPETYRGSFKCNDDEINRIWEVGAYTMHLTSREFFIDGIKRDRWVWSGDAIQSYLMNYYLFFDTETVKRTIWQLRGKDPVTSHINTIMDYTFFWFMSVYDYYMYTGDKHFVEQLYPRMQTMMEYVLGRTNKNGMVEGLTGDWVFIDWADKPMAKKGELAFEQVLFCKSLETMALCAALTNNNDDQKKYSDLAVSLRSKLLPTFWNESKKALTHSTNGEEVTRYANMFAVFFNYLDDAKKNDIKQSVLLNDNIMKITTPYMRFYELEALCELGEQSAVMKEMKNYWGGMLREGATSFWEKYNPNESGSQHLAMYGRPYGKSLCHAWGASPIYLLGKYYLGIRPTAPNYQEFTIKPSLGELKWMEGDVPTTNGNIHLYMNDKTIKIIAPAGKGKVYFSSKKKPKSNVGKPMATNKLNEYCLEIIGNGKEIVITY